MPNHLKNKNRVLSVLLLFTLTFSFCGVFLPMMPLAHASFSFSDDFELANFNRWTGNTITSTSTVTISTVQAHSPTHSMFCNIPNVNGAAGFYYLNMASDFYSLYGECYFYWNNGTILAGNDGLKIYGYGTAVNGANVNVQLTNNSGNIVWTIRYHSLSDGQWHNVYSATTAVSGQWYQVDLTWSTSSASLSVDGAQVIAPFALNMDPCSYFEVGDLYNGGFACSAYYDDASVSDSAPSSISASDYMQSWSIGNTVQNNYLQYPTVADGFLWLVESGYGAATIEKHDLTSSNNLIASHNLGHNLFECFSALVVGGYIFIPGRDAISNGKSVVVVLRESDMSELAYWTTSSGAQGQYALCAIYDASTNSVLVGIDTMVGIVRYLQIPVATATNTATWSLHDVADLSSVGVANPEDQLLIFNNPYHIFSNGVVYYCLECNLEPGSSTVFDTRLYAAPNGLSGAWILQWTKTGEVPYNSAHTASYFAHFSASNSYLVVGVISNAGGTSTYRLEYMGVNYVWNEYDTHIPVSIGENHLNINSISSNLFLCEISVRWGVQPHAVFIFDPTQISGTPTIPLFTTVGESLGYNDRVAGYDLANKVVYLGDCLTTNPTSSLIKITLNSSIDMMIPDYLTQTLYYIDAPQNGVHIGGGMLTITPSNAYNGAYIPNTPVTVIATPDSGYLFDHFVISGSGNYSQTPFQTNINSNFSIAAYFVPVRYGIVDLFVNYYPTLDSGNLTWVDLSTGANGIVGHGAENMGYREQSFPIGDAVTFTVTPNTGYAIRWVNVTGSQTLSPTTSQFTLTITGDLGVGVTFQNTPASIYSLTVLQTDGGNVRWTDAANSGTNRTYGSFIITANHNLTFYATPNSGYQFAYWYTVPALNPVYPEPLLTENPFALTLTTNLTIEAIFAANQINITNVSPLPIGFDSTTDTPSFTHFELYQTYNYTFTAQVTANFKTNMSGYWNLYATDTTTDPNFPNQIPIYYLSGNFTQRISNFESDTGSIYWTVLGIPLGQTQYSAFYLNVTLSDGTVIVSSAYLLTWENPNGPGGPGSSGNPPGGPTPSFNLGNPVTYGALFWSATARMVYGILVLAGFTIFLAWKVKGDKSLIIGIMLSLIINVLAFGWPLWALLVEVLGIIYLLFAPKR